MKVSTDPTIQPVSSHKILAACGNLKVYKCEILGQLVHKGPRIKNFKFNLVLLSYKKGDGGEVHEFVLLVVYTE